MSHLLFKLAASSLALTAVNVAAIAAAPAEKHAARAEKALAKKKTGAAIASAEAATTAAPRDAAMRMLLGRAYLEAGRYRSAAASFADALALSSTSGSAALSLALAQIGLGEQDAARATLDAHGEKMAAGDRGLALALVGDPIAGVTVLEAEVRGGSADAKTRQNLALAYALAGRWPEAKLMASYDLDPATVSQRIMEWSRFAREQQASAQVAALLGVAPGADPGLPAQLALNLPAAAIQVAQAEVPPPPVAMVEAAAPLTAPTETAKVAAVPFAAPTEVVQRIAEKAAVLPSKPAPTRVQPALFMRPTGGRFVVQVGAFGSGAVAESAWSRLTSRIAGLRGFDPSIATVVRGGATFHRLSVSGFASRSVAVSFCERLRAHGGQCFVRESAGDAPLQWARRGGGPRLAAR